MLLIHSAMGKSAVKLGIYLGIWFLIVYRWGLKKKGEVCTLIHFIMLGLNLLAMITSVRKIS